MAYTSQNKLNKFIRVQKDQLPTGSQSGVVYKITCKNCEASYVGQTRRFLNTRVLEHKNHITRNTTQHSVITDHRISESHDFDWDNVEILDKENVLNKRLSEMIFIRKQKQPF